MISRSSNSRPRGSQISSSYQKTDRVSNHSEREDFKNLDKEIQQLNETGLKYYTQNEYWRAGEFFDQSLKLNPQHTQALGWRAEIAIQLDENELAARLYKRLYKQAPGSFQEYGKLGYALYELGQTHEAVKILFKAIHIDPDDLTSHSNLGRALYDLYSQHKIETAMRISKAWLRQFPDNPDAQHMGAAILFQQEDCAIELPARANAAFVHDLFENFADTFDHKLAEIKYQAPEHIAYYLSTILPLAHQSTILDLGCGTGLSGQALKPFARRLIGVDLSQKMLEIAREKQIYDLLIEDDLDHVFKTLDEFFDIVTAVDVLCYLGDLKKLHENVYRCLEEGGYFCYSVEDNDQKSHQGYKLTPSGRYQHHPQYLEQCARDTNFRVITSQKTILRLEYDQPVEGWVMLMRKMS
ncbi:MAG: methyltransferase domain-containing protein [Pseudomonadota bacterium]